MAYFSTMWTIFLLEVFLISYLSCEQASKPVFLKSKVYYTSKIGQTVRLKCLIANSTKATIKWTKDGVNVGKNGAVKGHYKVIKRRMGVLLRIKNTEKKDAGEYVCEAVNKYGSASRKLNLTIKGKNKKTGASGEGKPWFIKPPVTRGCTFGLAWPVSSDIKLKCEADGERPLSYRWFKNGKSDIHRPLDPKMNTTRWYLRIKTAIPSDNGLYTCVVSNRLGNISKSIKFTVLERRRPSLSIGYPKNKRVKSGSNVTFECRELVRSILTDYRWLKWNKLPKNYPRIQLNDSIITDSNSSDYRLINPKHYESFKVRDINDPQLYGGRVHLQNVSKEDAGLYTCLVRNHIDSVSRSAFLIIDDKEPTQLTAMNQRTYPQRWKNAKK